MGDVMAWEDEMGWGKDIDGMGVGMWRGRESICDGYGRVGVNGSV